MANLIALYLLIALGAVLGGPIPPLPLDDLKTVDEPLLPTTAGTAGGPSIDRDLFAVVADAATAAAPRRFTAAAPKMLGSVLVVRIPLDGKEPFHSTAQVRTALYGSTKEEEVPSFRRTPLGNVLEVYCESALMADENCVGMMTKVTVRDLGDLLPPGYAGTSNAEAHYNRSFGASDFDDGKLKDDYSTEEKMRFWFERLLKETGEWDEYDRKIAIYPAQLNTAYNSRGSTIMARTQDTWTTYAHELGHDLGLPHSSAPKDLSWAWRGQDHAMFAYGDEALMGSREGKTDLNAAQRYQLGWIDAAAVLDDTGILKPLNVERTVFSPGLVLKQECAECWSKPVTSDNNQNKPAMKGGTLIASFRVGRDAGGDNNDFGIVGADLVNKVHVHFLSAKEGVWGTTQRWAVLAEGEEYEWSSAQTGRWQSGNGAVLGGLVVCKLVVTTETTDHRDAWSPPDYAAIAVGTDAADARSKCDPWVDSYPETLSIAGSPAAYVDASRPVHHVATLRGQYTRAAGLEHAGAPVYERNGYFHQNRWLLYKRFNGKWYLDLDLDMYKVSNGMGYLDFESWSGTVNYALTASDTPFTATWNRDMVVAHSTVTVVGKASSSARTAGVYDLDLQTTFAGAPVYRGRGTTWSLYKRSNGYWYLDSNELDDTWAGTVYSALSATDLPFDATFKPFAPRYKGTNPFAVMKVLRGSSWA